ncbi:unnamed protein product [Alopecurus aequalis]
MGATASRRRSSPSLPTKCSVKETKSTTRLFTVPNYTKAVTLPAGSVLYFQRPLRLLGHGYCVQVYPAGLDQYTDFVAVFVVPIESCGGKGYLWFVKRKDLEASGCVRDDMFTVRCTVFDHVWVTRSLAKAMASLPVDASSSTLSGSHTLAIGSFSKLKAALQTGECVHSTQFSLGGSSWYFQVYPNGHCDDDKTVSIFLCRGRSHELATMVEFSFEIIGDMEGPGPFTECTFDNNNSEHEFPYHHLMILDGDADHLILRCHLRVMRVTTPSLLTSEADDQPV